MLTKVETGIAGRKRLEPQRRDQEILPWRRARELERCSLYWLPVSNFPVPPDQRQWLLQFLDAVSNSAKDRFGLRSEVFLQYKSTIDLATRFQKLTFEFLPMLGLGYRPGSKIPSFPSHEELKRMADGEAKFDLKDWVADYCYWFLSKSGKRQREEFLGHGGMTTILLKPDPGTAPPPLPPSAKVSRGPTPPGFDIDGLWACTFAMTDSFLAKSKELFGAGLEERQEFPGLPFILPLLSTADFFCGAAEDCDKWFQLFDMYVNESPRDRGFVLASKVDLDEFLIDLLSAMREQGLSYPLE